MPEPEGSFLPFSPIRKRHQVRHKALFKLEHLNNTSDFSGGSRQKLKLFQSTQRQERAFESSGVTFGALHFRIPEPYSVGGKTYTGGHKTSWNMKRNITACLGNCTTQRS
jgi:hypothetical protein